ncbi:hypothetical protein [Planococcus soli]|uniref:hypothetical protein n=1 Tax=Planococcus soli TaxID=2666072 RepID=UPI00115F040A|nr:hypothetical protein [Planococcus soli]
MQLLLERLFVICLLSSILLGLIMVGGQLIGLLFGNGEMVVQSSELLKQPTIILAAIFSGFAFILGYFPDYKEKGE